jgi:predicted nucleotide-binding protein
MRIVIVEDDFLQAEWVLSALDDQIGDIAVERITSEYGFRCRFEELTAACPELFIMDIMLPWSEPEGSDVPQPPDVKRGGAFHAGLRCARMLTQDPRTRGCYIVLHSVLERSEIEGEIKSLGPKVKFLQKGTDQAGLARLVRFVSAQPQRADPEFPGVFVVHGRDSETRETVARLLHVLRLNPILLFERVSSGSITVIEKLEKYADVSSAVVLLTPDDVGALHGSELQPRARQNVIFELGYFVSRVGRKNVFALYKEGVELPSDYHGVLYIPIDPNGAWRLQLARELKASGLPIDLNEVF